MSQYRTWSTINTSWRNLLQDAKSLSKLYHPWFTTAVSPSFWHSDISVVRYVHEPTQQAPSSAMFHMLFALACVFIDFTSLTRLNDWSVTAINTKQYYHARQAYVYFLLILTCLVNNCFLEKYVTRKHCRCFELLQKTFNFDKAILSTAINQNLGTLLQDSQYHVQESLVYWLFFPLIIKN